jgi:hypothetical protein
MKCVDLAGKQFNFLTVLHRVATNRSGNSTWLCKCKCGNDYIASADHLTRKSNPIQSCGCYRKNRYGKHHSQWNGCGDISGNWWNARIDRWKYSTRIKLENTLTKEQAWDLFIKQNKKCALSGIDLVISNDRKLNNASIDRIDSSQGYHINNIQWVHKDVNFMKRTYNQDYFINLCKLIAHNQEI